MPPKELNFDQWYVDMKASQQQYPDAFLLLAFKKSLNGPVVSVV